MYGKSKNILLLFTLLLQIETIFGYLGARYVTYSQEPYYGQNDHGIGAIAAEKYPTQGKVTPTKMNCNDRPGYLCSFDLVLPKCYKKLNGTGTREENILDCINCVTGVANNCRDEVRWSTGFIQMSRIGFCQMCDWITKCKLRQCWDMSITQTLIENKEKNIPMNRMSLVGESPEEYAAKRKEFNSLSHPEGSNFFFYPRNDGRIVEYPSDQSVQLYKEHKKKP